MVCLVTGISTTTAAKQNLIDEKLMDMLTIDKNKFLKIIICFIIPFLFSNCNKYESKKTINKTTIITYLGKSKLHCETNILIPKGIFYNVRSDGICGGLEPSNISVSKNGIQLPLKMYLLEAKYIKNIYNPIYGRITAIYKSIRYESHLYPNSQRDSIHFSYNILVSNPNDSLKKYDFIQIFLSESIPSTNPILEVNSQLIQRTLDDTFIPRQRLRQDMKVLKGDKKYEFKYLWKNKSQDLSHNALSPYQAIGFTRNIYFSIGEVSQTLDLSKFGMIKETYVAKIRRGLKEEMKLKLILIVILKIQL